MKTRLTRSLALSGISVAALATIGSVGWARPASANNIYMDGVRGAQYNSGSAASPFQYLWEALQVARPGDTIYVVPSMTYPFLGFVANGAPGAPITLSGLSSSNPTYVSGGWVNSGVWIDGNYLTVKNFNFTAPGLFPAVDIPAYRNHITIADNVIHDSGANGINTYSDDYITISHNIVYNNARNTSQAFGSGISMLGSIDSDSNTGVKMIIDGNTVFGNTNVPNCNNNACWANASDSDGSGIILDDNKREQFDNNPYHGAFMISNNVIYGNGGRGVHVYRSDNATITGNTIYKNNQDPYEDYWHAGEVSVLESGNVSVYDNILYSDGFNGFNRTGSEANSHVAVSFENCTDNWGPLVAAYNLGYNRQNDGSRFYYGLNNYNPVYQWSNIWAGASLNYAYKSDFKFAATSHAYKAGNYGASPRVDMLGVTRGSYPSMGAYQSPGP